jgi:hypothetical protein
MTGSGRAARVTCRSRSRRRRPSATERGRTGTAAAGVAAVYTPKDYHPTAIMADIVEIVERAAQKAA